MNDDQKTREQLLEELERERERSLALQEVSKKVAGAHNTEEILDLIVNEAARLLGGATAIIRLLDGDILVPRAATKDAVITPMNAPIIKVGDKRGVASHVMATKKPVYGDEVNQVNLPEVRLAFEEQGRDPAAIAGIPLLANDQSIGAFTVAFTTYGCRFTEDEIVLLTAFADQASLALEKARPLNEAESEKERADALYRVSNLLAGAHDTDEVLDLIVNEATRLVGASAAWMRLLDGDLMVPSAATESAAAYIAEQASIRPTLAVGEGASTIGHVMATKEPMVGEDFPDLVPPEVRKIIHNHGFHGFASVPLLANDRSIGVLTVTDTRQRSFTENEVTLLTAFADQAALALDKARLLNEAEARERQATQLYEVTTRLASSQDIDSVLDLIAARAVDLLGCEATAIFEYDPVRDGLAIVRTYNLPLEMEQSIFLKPGESTSGLAFQQRKPMWTRDRLSSQAFTQSIGETTVRNSGVGGTASQARTRDRLSSQAFTQSIGETTVRNSGVGGTASHPGRPTFGCAPIEPLPTHPAYRRS